MSGSVKIVTESRHRCRYDAAHTSNDRSDCRANSGAIAGANIVTSPYRDGPRSSWRDARPGRVRLPPQAFAERERKNRAQHRLHVVKPDFFVLPAAGPEEIYLRGTFKGRQSPHPHHLYDQATENTVEPVVIAMSQRVQRVSIRRADRRTAASARPWNTAPA